MLSGSPLFFPSEEVQYFAILGWRVEFWEMIYVNKPKFGGEKKFTTPLRKPCKDCEETFQPKTRFCRYCERCLDKRISAAKIKKGCSKHRRLLDIMFEEMEKEK